MKITNVLADYVRCPLQGTFHPTWGTGLSMDYVGMTVVRIETDEGVTGIAAGTANSWENVVGINVFLREQLIGQDPLMIERLRPLISNAKLRMGWPWMVEAALWDLAGKYCGMPVYRMWGGFSNQMRIYASTGEIHSLEERRAYVETCIRRGFQAVKLRMHSPRPQDDLEVIRQLVADYGNQISFMVDANQADHLPGASDIHTAWDTYTALYVARELEKLGILWLEEPLARFNYEGLELIARKVNIPLAGGEKNTGLNEFRTLAERTGYHILQGDCIFSEGMFQMRKAAALAEAYHKLFIPHTWSNPCGLYANIQIAASLPNCPWLELPFEPPAYTEALYSTIFEEGLQIQNGWLTVPDRPGLGFTLREGFLEQYRVPFQKEAIGI